jgi:kynurenine formamidase
MSNLADLAQDIASQRVRVIDLTQTLSPDFPTLILPPQFGQCAPFRIEEISRYDARGGGEWYWNNFSCSEHTGTHFDAPIHWVTGRDLSNNSVDTIEPRDFIAGACVIDCARVDRPAHRGLGARTWTNSTAQLGPVAYRLAEAAPGQRLSQPPR